MCVHIHTRIRYITLQFGGGSKPTYLRSKPTLVGSKPKPYISALSTGHGPSESTIVLRNYIFEQFGKPPM